jgi:hypothetical protein
MKNFDCGKLIKQLKTEKHKTKKFKEIIAKTQSKTVEGYRLYKVFGHKIFCVS